MGVIESEVISHICKKYTFETSHSTQSNILSLMIVVHDLIKCAALRFVHKCAEQLLLTSNLVETTSDHTNNNCSQIHSLWTYRYLKWVVAHFQKCKTIVWVPLIHRMIRYCCRMLLRSCNTSRRDSRLSHHMRWLHLALLSYSSHYFFCIPNASS